MKNLALAKLQRLAIANTLPHAWLFASYSDNMNLSFAMEFSKWVLCLGNNKQQNACEVCKSCHLFGAHTHPDFCEITTAIDKTSIAIDDVRSVINFVVSKPQLAAYKIVLLHPAEGMQKQAANAILKNLEEPVNNTIFILLTKQPKFLLPTIVSRCQLLNLPIDQDYLSMTSNVDMVKMTTDLTELWVYKSITAVQIVEQWIKQWPNQVLYWFELVLADLIRFKYIGESTSSIAAIATLDQVLPANRLWKMLDSLRQAQYWYANNHNPNLQLLLESLLLTT